MVVLSPASIALRVAAITAWGGFMIGMANWSNTNAALVGAGIATVLLGACVGHWWVLLVPIVPGALLALGTLIADPDEFHENSPASWAAYIALWTVAIAVWPRTSRCGRWPSPYCWRSAWRSVACHV